jgi:hypothetical protein
VDGNTDGHFLNKSTTYTEYEHGAWWQVDLGSKKNINCTAISTVVDNDLIDVDGTLVDSVPDLAYCVDELMVTMGREKWGEAQVRHWVRELEFGVEVFTDNSQMVMQCDVVVLAVKPQILLSVCKQIKTHTHRRPCANKTNCCCLLH